MLGMTVQDFVQRLFALVARPFAPEKCIPASYSVLHLGLINDLTRWGQKHTIRLTPRPGKVEELLAQLSLLCQLTETGVDEVASLAGGLMFLTTGCYEELSRGGIRPSTTGSTKPAGEDRTSRRVESSPTSQGGYGFRWSSPTTS